jgi:hypothetical protein
MYSEDARRIYEYEDPTTPGRRLYADPLALRRAVLDASAGDIDRFLDEAESDDPLLAAHAESRLVTIARSVWECPPVDRETGMGVPDAVVLDMLNAFVEWLSEKKVSTGQ